MGLDEIQDVRLNISVIKKSPLHSLTLVINYSLHFVSCIFFLFPAVVAISANSKAVDIYEKKGTAWTKKYTLSEVNIEYI